MSEEKLVPVYQSLEQAKITHDILVEMREKLFTKGVDYGVIPGTSGKPTLFKPGADKLKNRFLFQDDYVELKIVEELTGYNPVFFYRLKCVLQHRETGQVWGTGLGSCNSMERKYQRQDPCSIANTILKMAKKRAFLDAILSATGASQFFTQDMEDIENFGTAEKSKEYVVKAVEQKPKEDQWPAWDKGAPEHKPLLVEYTDPQKKVIKELVKEKIINIAKVENSTNDAVFQVISKNNQVKFEMIDKMDTHERILKLNNLIPLLDKTYNKLTQKGGR